MTDTANLGLTNLEAASSQKHVSVNEGWRVLDAIAQLGVVDKDLTSPPGSPAEGATYIVGASATGLWVGQDANIAYYAGGSWFFHTPALGWIAYVADEAKLYRYDGGWAVMFSGATFLAGNGTAALPAYSFASDPDTGMYRNAANELGFAVNGVQRALMTATQLTYSYGSVLFNRATDDIEFKMNKEAAADDARLNFQTNFSTRALVGTLANDDYTIKVSPNGSTFYDALVVDKDNGAVTLVQASKFKAYCNYRQYCAANTWVKVDTNNERYDKNNDYNTGTKRFVARIPGIHHFDAVIEHSVNGTVPTSIDLALYVNGVIVAYATRKVSGTIIEGTTVAVSEDLDLTAADYVELFVRMVGQDGYVQTDTNGLAGHYVA